MPLVIISTVPAVSLASKEITVFENNSSVNVTVMREGDMDSEIVVKLKTSQLVEENAAIGEDYSMKTKFSPKL